LNHNRTLGQQFFDNASKALSLNYTRRKVFDLRVFNEKARFIHLAQHTSVNRIILEKRHNPKNLRLQ